MGALTRGMTGGGFLYTNKDSISLGIVVGMEQMRRRTDDLESWQLLDEFKELPQIKPLVAGGTVAEYSAHAIPEGGISQVPTLAGDGYLMAGDAAGLSLNALVTVRGMDFAIACGYYAARAALAAREAGDYSAAAPAAPTSRRCATASCSRTSRRRVTSPPSSRTRASSRDYPEAVTHGCSRRVHVGERPQRRPRQDGLAQRPPRLR